MKLKLEDYLDQDKLASGTLKLFSVEMDSFPDKRLRTIRVWLPDSYDEVKKFPVLYMHDGQNLFSGLDERWKWYADKEMKKVSEKIQPIIVAVDTDLYKRAEELFPAGFPVSAFFKENFGNPIPKGDLYRDFIADTLKPLIDRNFKTKPEKQFTAIGGSSMGGIESLYIHVTRPDVFGLSLCFSTATNITDDKLVLKWLNENADRIKDDRIFFMTGGETMDYTLIRPSVELYDTLIRSGMDYHHVALLIDSRLPHYESSWQKYFAEAVTYLFNEDNSVVFPPENQILLKQ